MQVAITDCLKIRDGSHGSLLNQLREGRTRQGQLVIPHRLNYQQFSHVTKTLCFQSRADAKTRNQGANTLADCHKYSVLPDKRTFPRYSKQ